MKGNSWGQLFKRNLASVKQRRVLSHFQFAERSFVNTIFKVDTKAFVFLKEPTKDEIWRSKDFLNRGLSWTSFK